jgi:hypothetical protein
MVREILLTLLVVFAVLTAGCQNRYGPAAARVEITVLEVPTQYLREYTLGKGTQEMADSSYSLTALRPEELDSLQTRPDANARLLHFRRREIDRWPRVTDNWSYTTGRDDGLGQSTSAGGGAGFLGVRERESQLEIRIDYLVTHRGVLGQRSVESKIFYEHFYPAGNVLVFHAPAGLLGRKPSHHIIAFHAVRTDVAPRPGPFSVAPTRRE